MDEPRTHEEVETTRAEKVLALGLAVFLLIGGFWVTRRLERLAPRVDQQALEVKYRLPELRQPVMDWDRLLGQAGAAVAKKGQAAEEARAAYEFRREEYRVTVDRGAPDAAKELLYQQALAAFEAARAESELARDAQEQLTVQAEPAKAALARAEQAMYAEWSRLNDRTELVLFLLRFGWAAPVLVLSIHVWQRARRRGSQLLIAATALLGAAVIQLAVLVGRYSWHLLRDSAMLAVSVVGSALTVYGLVLLKRYAFSPERLARGRWRKGQCLRCGHPAAGAHCAACGTSLTRACGGCGAAVPVMAKFCPGCGACV